MKDIKSYLINEAKSYNLNNIKYTMVSYYLREEARAYLIEDISEISDIYYDWDLTPEKVDEIIKKVENLQSILIIHIEFIREETIYEYSCIYRSGKFRNSPFDYRRRKGTQSQCFRHR